MKIVITGGAGFIGTKLAINLLSAGLTYRSHVPEAIVELVILDQLPPPPYLAADSRVRSVCLDLYQALADSDSRLEAALHEADVVFHLAAAVSSECEADFDLGMRANVDVTRGLLNACRKLSPACRLIYASSLAVYGVTTQNSANTVIGDSTLAAPLTSYGHQKLICEHLVSDYARRRFLDARSLRLMTVVVRPGKANGAASSFLSSIVREPLRGLTANCPVSVSTRFAVSSPSRTIHGLVRAAETPIDIWGANEAMNLPALSLTVGDLLDALKRVVGSHVVNLVKFHADPVVQSIVETWPASFCATRAEAFGLHPNGTADELIDEFLATQAGTPARSTQ